MIYPLMFFLLTAVISLIGIGYKKPEVLKFSTFPFTRKCLGISIIAYGFSLIISGCKTKEQSREQIQQKEISLSLDRSVKYTLVPPIPKDDKWLASFKKGHGYGDGWETWIWRKTDINIGEGISVYARDQNEQQFLIKGVNELDEITVDYRHKDVGEAWSFGATHIGSITPSGNYVVVITSYPRTYLSNGMSLKERYKTDAGWDFSYSGDKLTLWKRTGRN